MKINEKQIIKLMKSLDLTREETIQLIKDDLKTTDKTAPTAEQNELSSKPKFKTYVATEKTKGRNKTRPPKIDDNRIYLIKTIFDLINSSNISLSDLTIANPQTEIVFNYKERNYSLKLIRHNLEK